MQSTGRRSVRKANFIFFNRFFSEKQTGNEETERGNDMQQKVTGGFEPGLAAVRTISCVYGVPQDCSFEVRCNVFQPKVGGHYEKALDAIIYAYLCK